MRPEASKRIQTNAYTPSLGPRSSLILPSRLLCSPGSKAHRPTDQPHRSNDPNPFTIPQAPSTTTAPFHHPIDPTSRSSHSIRAALGPRHQQAHTGGRLSAACGPPRAAAVEVRSTPKLRSSLRPCPTPRSTPRPITTPKPESTQRLPAPPAHSCCFGPGVGGWTAGASEQKR